MMNRSLLPLIFLLVSLSAYSQRTMKIFFDEDWEETKEAFASYYRIVTKLTDGYQVQDYYMNDTIQMNGIFSDKKCTIYNGKFEWYDSLGVMSKSAFYENDHLENEYFEYYFKGKIKIKCFYVKGERNGLYEEYYPDGSLRATANFEKGYLKGPAFRYYEDSSSQLKLEIDNRGNGKVIANYANGNLKTMGSLQNGYRIGEWTYYNEDGTLSESIQKEEETDIRKKQTDLKKLKPEDSLSTWFQSLGEIFFHNYSFDFHPIKGLIEFPDVEAEFIGGASALQHYIGNNVRYPQAAIKRNKQGKVYVSFVVRPDGSITDVSIEKGPIILHKESIRLVKNMPNWKPGEFKGKKVATRCRLPINYTLN